MKTTEYRVLPFKTEDIEVGPYDTPVTVLMVPDQEERFSEAVAVFVRTMNSKKKIKVRLHALATGPYPKSSIMVGTVQNKNHTPIHVFWEELK